MRIFLKLKAAKDFEYDTKYHSKFQGFIYRQLIDTPYRYLHEKKGYKFFCFSNLFPLKIKDKEVLPIYENDTKYWIISSPDLGFIYVLSDKISRFIESDTPVYFGEMEFYIESIKTINSKIKRRKNFTIRTETPIILRIGKKTYQDFGIKPPRSYRYLFWRREWPFELFIKNLNDNLVNKYREFYQLKKEEYNVFRHKVLPLFQRLQFIDSVVNHVIINGKEQKFFGSLWKFYFDSLNKDQKTLLEFALDTGFGEKNSYGFGFVNIF